MPRPDRVDAASSDLLERRINLALNAMADRLEADLMIERDGARIEREKKGVWRIRVLRVDGDEREESTLAMKFRTRRDAAAVLPVISEAIRFFRAEKRPAIAGMEQAFTVRVELPDAEA
jgi:hypothetical protein